MNKILFLGPIGTYSYKVAVELQKNILYSQIEPKKTFQEIHNDILNNKNYIGILPIENSITTNIYENIEFIFDNEVNIIGEYYLPIILNLIGKKGFNFDLSDKNNKNVYSHQKALKQTSNFIQKYNFNPIISNSTTEGQNIILNSNNNDFCIGDYPIYNDLEIKKENIGNYKNNKTRFIFVSKENIILQKSKQNKISFICKLKHQKGSLCSFLDIILKNNINMTKIESKPIPDSNFEYIFLIEGITENSISYKELKNILNMWTIKNRIIGIYSTL